jgi:hypothetical protein
MSGGAREIFSNERTSPKSFRRGSQLRASFRVIARKR